MNKRANLVTELQRRNVFKVAIAYVVSSWLLAQVADLVLDNFGAPDWAMRALLITLAIGFPIALGISWAFEVTSHGVIPEREIDRTVSITDQSGKRLDRSIIIILAIVIVFMGLERFVFSGHDSNEAHNDSRAESGILQPASRLPDHITERSGPPSPLSVAVLPFTVMSTGPDDNYFADGLTEEIINALSQLPELMVTARTSAFYFKGENLPIGEIAGKLGVANVVEGSVRRAGEQLRITAQLVRAEDGFHLWSETYDRRTEDTFAVQQDIAEKVASALNILLDEKQLKRMQQAGLRNVDAFIALQKGYELFSKAHNDGIDISLLRHANGYFEEVTMWVPDFSAAYILHSDFFTHVLTSDASGQLDGKITAADSQQAPQSLRSDYDQALRSARNESQRLNVQLDRAILLGDWRGLQTLTEQSLARSDCEGALWAHLVGGPFGSAWTMNQAFARMYTCDPLDVRAPVHLARSYLWMNQPTLAQEMAEKVLKSEDHHWLIWAEIFALAMQGDFQGAEKVANTRPLTQQDRFYLLSLLASMQGNAESAEQYLNEFLAINGPDDQAVLVMMAAQGNRAESNRVASVIDSRPFGYLALLNAIHLCMCGAPFELDYTPHFADMLEDSGLIWPPLSPVTYPLKEW